MRQRLRHAARHWRAVAAMLSLAGMVLLGTAPAQAATTGHGHGARVTAGAAAKLKAKADRLVQAQSGTSDARAVCEAVKVGYSTCMALMRTNIKSVKGIHPDQTPVGYGPSSLQSAYNLPSATAGSGQTVAIVDAYDDPNAEADLQTYRAQYGLPVCDTGNGCFQKVNQDGQTSPLPPPAGSNGWDVEESLDVDMVSAICPNCHIILVEANSNSDSDLYTAEDTAVTMGAKFVSNSWAGSEYSGETTDDAYFNHPGVAITAAAGDFGYGPLFPSASQYVTSIGGTSLTQDSSTRGWSETAWDGTGSGCSSFEPKPAWQTDTGCSNRTETDVSAVADPNTGVALYDSYSAGGWTEVGGTSVATPIIASTYALAGTPVAGTYPSSYPYQHTSSLNDVTSGSNGVCSPSYLCTAGTGYDGPTGLGTPDGVNAFQGAPSGVLSGQVSNKSGPLAGATVSAGSGYTATTDSSGDFTMTVPDGTYNVTAEAFGYKSQTVSGITISQGQTTTQNFTLKSVPSHTLSGTVTDGSGHKWPLYAAISVSGYPGGAVYTNPYTGQYSINLPDKNTYSLSVTPVYPGYTTATAPVKMTTVNKTKNFKVLVDNTACQAPGYAFAYKGSTEGFTGWTGTTAQDGWTNVDNEGNGQDWEFNNPGDLTPPLGGDADFAVVDSLDYGFGSNQDTSLVSPVENLSGDSTPVINFDTYYDGYFSQVADVDLSLDGGQTWSNVWEQTTNLVDGPVSIQIPQAAGQSDVEVRFHYTQNQEFGFWWEVDNVFIGNQKCAPLPGGLVDGIVNDNNTGNAVNGAAVTSASNPAQSGVSSATPNDPNLSDGFYWLFASPGSTQFTASDGNYTPSTQTVDVASNSVTHQNWTLQAGNLAITPGSLSVSQTLGGAKTKTVKFTNTGTQPVQVQLNDQGSGFTPMGVKPGDKAALKGAPLEKIRGHYSTAAMVLQAKAKTHGGKGLELRQPAPSDAPWAAIANYPSSIMDNAVGYDPGTGNVYSAGGYDGTANVANAYVYSASAQAWSAIAPLPQALESPAGAFVNGTFYAIGGWDSSGNPTADVYAYNPAGNSWSQVASLPTAVSAPATAELNGTLYVIGGCTTGNCGPGSDAVYSYSASSNSWTQLANYPSVIAFEACAGINSEIVCAGGNNPGTGASSSSTYIYNTSSNSWSQGADMPFDDWAMVYGGSGNKLQIAAGVTDNSLTVTNQAAEYDPSSNSWTMLPNANDAEYRGGGACGLYQVGGSTGGFSPTPFAEVLPGDNQCGSETIPWLSTSSSKFTLNPGQSTTVGVTMDSSAVSQPGAYTAQLAVQTNSPYQFQPIGITMQVNPPSTWSKITGTVTDASSGNPLAGATIQICTQYNRKTGTCGSVSYTLTTDSSGNYQLWLNRGYNPLQIIAAMDKYMPISKIAQLTKGITTTVNFALSKTG